MIDFLKPTLLFFTLTLFIGACKEVPEKTPSEIKKYSLFIIDQEGNPYIVQTNSLDSGNINPAAQGIRKERRYIDRDIMVKNGFYYKLNPRTFTFTKFQNQNGLFNAVDSTVMKGVYIENYKWLSNDSLLLLDMNREEGNYFLDYVKVNINNLKFIKGRTLLPVPKENYGAISVGFSEIKNDVLLLGYSYFYKDAENYKVTDTSYLAVFDYPSIKLKDVTKDIRSVHPGGENAVEPGSFIDEKGDLYFLTCPGVALGNSPGKPTSLMRVKQTESQTDTTYFFNISTSSIQNHAYSVYYIGNRKAIIRSERKDLFTRWDEHWKVPHFEFYVVDIDTKTVNKLNLPLDKGTRRQCVLKEGDTIYISINSEKEGNYIWKYNLKTSNLTKGLQLTGPTSYILRLDKLN